MSIRPRPACSRSWAGRVARGGRLELRHSSFSKQRKAEHLEGAPLARMGGRTGECVCGEGRNQGSIPTIDVPQYGTSSDIMRMLDRATVVKPQVAKGSKWPGQFGGRHDATHFGIYPEL